jgi:hypothetical protein
VGGAAGEQLSVGVDGTVSHSTNSGSTYCVLCNGRAPRAYARTGSTGGLPTLYNPVYFPISKGPTLLLSVSKLPYAAKSITPRIMAQIEIEGQGLVIG